MYVAIASNTKLDISLWTRAERRERMDIHEIVRTEQFRECRLIARQERQYIYACDVDRLQNIRDAFESDELDVVAQMQVQPGVNYTKFCNIVIMGSNMLTRVEAGSSVWEHHSGRVYRLKDIANLESDKPQFPAMAYYENVDNSKTYARPMHEFLQKMEPYTPH